MFHLKKKFMHSQTLLSPRWHSLDSTAIFVWVLQMYTLTRSVLQCVAVCCSVLQCVAVCCSVLQCVAVCCSVLQCVAVCCSVLQCVAMCGSVVSTLQRAWRERVQERVTSARRATHHEIVTTHCNRLQHTATHCSTLRVRVTSSSRATRHEIVQRDRSVLQCVLQCVVVCCSVLQCVAVCCSVLQCVLQCVARWGHRDFKSSKKLKMRAKRADDIR